MRKLLAILSLALMLAPDLAAQDSASSSGSYTVETVPNVQLVDARRFTTNPDGILSPATEAEIDRLCLDLRQKQLAEVVVLVLERVGDNSLDMFAHNVLNRWGVGQKGKDNGLVISVVRSQRDIQFATGYGIEGVLPDAICKRIQTVYMADALRAGDFDGGVLAGVKAAYNVLTDNQEELTALKAADNGSRPFSLGIFGPIALLVVVFVAVLIVIAARHNSDKGGGRGKGPDQFGGPGAGGYTGSDAGSIIGGILGGLLGGGFGGGFGGGGGGGFGGGGFGGGRSGGGGARTGF